MTQSLQSAGGPPPTTLRDDPCAAVAVARAERAAEDSAAWKAGGFPAYLQNEVDDFCAAWDDALQVGSPIHSCSAKLLAKTRLEAGDPQGSQLFDAAIGLEIVACS